MGEPDPKPVKDEVEAEAADMEVEAAEEGKPENTEEAVEVGADVDPLAQKAEQDTDLQLEQGGLTARAGIATVETLAPVGSLPLPPLEQIPISDSGGPTRREQLRNARDRVARENKYDADAWSILVDDADASNDVDAARIVFEHVLKLFPTAGRFWKLYAEFEIRHGHPQRAEQVFMKSLLKCLNLDLWKSYIKYVKKHKCDDGDDSRDRLMKAYSFALNHIGHDVHAARLWRDYIEFVKSGNATSEVEKGQQIAAIRRLYKSATQIPLHKIDELWNEWNDFETKLNAIMAPEIIARSQMVYTAAKTALAKQRNIRNELVPNLLPVPPDSNAKSLRQLQLWKKLITFEINNPQRLSERDLHNRIVFTYEQCLLCFCHYPEMWHDYATYMLSQDKMNEARRIYRRGVEFIPEHSLLYFAWSQMEEGQKQLGRARALYELLIRRAPTPLNFISFQRFLRRTEGVQTARRWFARVTKHDNCTWHVYVAAAELEFCLNKDVAVARSIFDHGLKRYMHVPEFVMQYILLLEKINDEKNLKLLYVRALKALQPEQSREIWDKFLQFDALYGDASSTRQLRQQREEECPGYEANTLERYVEQFSFLDLSPCSKADRLALRVNTDDRIEDIINADSQVGRAGTGGRRSEAAARTSAVILKRPDLSRLALFDGTRPGRAAMSTAAPTGTLPDHPEVKSLRLAVSEAAVARLVVELPSANDYRGPRPDIEELMKALGVVNDELLAKALEELAKNPLPPPSAPERQAPSSSAPAASKRSAPVGGDVYRERQLKRSRK